MCVLLSLVDIVVIWVLSSQCLNVPQRGLSLWANPVNVPCLPSTLTLFTASLLSLQDCPRTVFTTLWTLLITVFVCLWLLSLVSLLVLFRLIGNLWFMPRWLSLNFWNVYASLNKRFVVWYICSVLKLSWSVIIHEVKDEYNELWNLQQPHHEHLKIPHISTDQIVIVVLKTMSDLGFCTNIRIKRRFNYRWRL